MTVDEITRASKESVRQQAFGNLPNKYRRQHGGFEFSGLDRFEIPVACATDNSQITKMLAKGLILPVQHDCGKRLVGYREMSLVASSAKICPAYGDVIDGDGEAGDNCNHKGQDEVWFLVCKKLPKSALAIISLVVIDDKHIDVAALELKQEVPETLDLLRNSLDMADDAIWEAQKTLDTIYRVE